MDVEQHIIISKDPGLAARRVCSWLNGLRQTVEILTVSQVAFEGSIHTTIFWRQPLVGQPRQNNSTYKSRPKTGEKRLTRQPLKIDRLPKSVHDAIVHLRQHGKVWLDIERISARPFSEKWATDGDGFVDWESLPAEIRGLFPEMRLAMTSLLRWYDLRIEQSAQKIAEI